VAAGARSGRGINLGVRRSTNLGKVTEQGNMSQSAPGDVVARL